MKARMHRLWIPSIVLCLGAGPPTEEQPLRIQLKGDVVVAKTSSVGARADYDPAMTAAQLRRAASILGLNETQHVLAQEMVREYLRTFDEAIRNVKKEYESLGKEAHSSSDFTRYARDVSAITARWTRESDALGAALFEDLKSLLTEEQVERWPLFEREKRRDDLMPLGRLAGEDVDVVELVAKLTLEDHVRTSLESLVDEYAGQLDRALVARERLIESLRDDWNEARMNDPDRAKDLWDQATGRRSIVREINRKTVRLLAGALVELGDDDAAAALQRAFEERAYPQAYAPTQAETYLETVVETIELSDTQAEQVAVIDRDLERDLSSARRKIISEILEAEKEPPPSIQRFEVAGENSVGFVVVAATTGDAEADPFQAAMQTKQEVSDRVLSRLQNVLTVTQRESMPQLINNNTSKSIYLGRLWRFNL